MQRSLLSGLFNVVVGIDEYIPSNSKMNDKWKTGKDLEGSGHILIKRCPTSAWKDWTKPWKPEKNHPPPADIQTRNLSNTIPGHHHTNLFNHAVLITYFF